MEDPDTGCVVGMTHNNPWFLITNDEIEEIRDQLRYCQHNICGAEIDRIRDIDNVLRMVRNRRP
jgi:hypothetical protein